MGGLLALSALERSPLQRVALQALPCQGGFVGLYHGMPPTHHMAVAALLKKGGHELPWKLCWHI